jgi:uncharacterized protein YraI
MLRLFALLICLLSCAGLAQADGRVALVVGNSAYQNASALPNPRNDAKAIADKLTAIGFNVLLREDLDGQGFRVALGEFSEEALNADIALFFYAGHGIELEGQNYLIPVDARMKSEATAQYETIPLDQVLSAVRSAHKLGMVMLDACRDNPFAATMSRSKGTRSVSRGLAPVSVEGEKGLLISFAAEAGRTAEDGDSQHSPYTEALLETIDTPGLEVGRLFRSVRAKVREKSGGRQVPIEQAQLPDEDIYLVGSAAPVSHPVQPVPAQPVPAQPLSMQPAAKPEAAPTRDPLLMYLTAKRKKDREALQEFLRLFPDHIRAKDARALLADLAEGDTWAKAKADGGDTALRAYLAAYPTGAHSAEALEALAALAPAPAAAPTAVVPPAPVAPAYLGNCPALTGKGTVTGVAENDTLFLRNGPSSNNPAIGELPFNATGMTITGCVQNWCQVQYGCLQGYAFQKYLSEFGTGSGGSADSGYYSVVDYPADEMIPVLSGPEWGYGEVSKLPGNATGVAVMDCDRSESDPFAWCQVSWNNVSGWVYGQYLSNQFGNKPQGNSSPPPAPAAPAAVTTGQSCFDLWYARNAIYAAKGYCFTSAEGKKWFDNSSCSTSNPKLSASEKLQVERYKQQEKAQGC